MDQLGLVEYMILLVLVYYSWTLSVSTVLADSPQYLCLCLWLFIHLTWNPGTLIDRL